MDIAMDGPILVVCADEGLAFEILQRLYDRGLEAVGPVPTAGLALALAAQTTARVALLAGETTGRRDLQALAAELQSAWGIDCFLLSPDGQALSTTAETRGKGIAAALRNALEAPALRRVELH